MQREAAIKITLKEGAFKSGLRSMETMTRSTGDRMGQALAGPMKAGVENAKASLKNMGNELTGTLKAAATLGGAVGLGALVKSAITAEARSARLAASLEKFSGRVVNAADAQDVLDRAVDRSKISYEEAGEALNQLSSVAAIGGLEMVEDALARSQLQAKRLGVTGEITARTYNRLLAKGVAKSAEEAENLVEQMSEFGRVTMGLDPDEAIDPNDVAEFASFAKQAGIEMGTALALMKSAGGGAVKDFGQASEFVEEFGNVFRDVKSLGDLRKDLGISPDKLNTSKDGLENFLTVLDEAGPKGVKSLLASFGNERTKASLRKLIGEDLVVDVEKGKKGSAERLKLRADEIRSELAKVADASGEFSARIERQNKALTGTSSSKLQDALNKFEKAFQKPEMISAIDSLAENLPELAKVLAKIVDFTLKNPKTAIAAAVGGRVGLSFAGGALADAGSKIGSKAAGVIAEGATGLGKQIGSSIVSTASAAGPWKTAGGVFAAAAAALIGHEIGKALSKETVEKSFDEASKTSGRLVASTASAHAARTTGDAESRKRALAALEADIAAAKKKTGLLSTDVDAGDAVSGLAFGPLGLLIKRVAAGSLATGSGEMSGAEKEAAALRESLNKAAGGGDKAGDAFARVERAASKAADALEKVDKAAPGGGASKGARPLGGVTPGSAPRSG